MGSKVPPMTPRRLGWPTSRIVGALCGTTVEPGTIRLGRSELLDPLPQPREVLLVVLGPRFAEPLFGVGSDLGELVPLGEHPVPGRPRLRPNHWERQVLVRLVELLVHRVDVDGPAPVGTHADLFEDLAGLGLPAAYVRQKVLHGPALREVSGLLDLRGCEGFGQPYELGPSGVLGPHQLTLGRHRLRHHRPFPLAPHSIVDRPRGGTRTWFLRSPPRRPAALRPPGAGAPRRPLPVVSADRRPAGRPPGLPRPPIARPGGRPRGTGDLPC